MKSWLQRLVFLAWILSAFVALGTVHYVDVNGTNPLTPFVDWSTAATNIQDAIGVSQSGDTVLVTNGVYNYGGVSIFQIGPVTNRVALTNAIAVASVNGPNVTILLGNQNYGYHIYPTRCAYVGNNSILSGFTLTNGASTGAYCEPSGVITNCIITGCNGSPQGSGVYRGIVYSSLITGNVSGGGSGAGAFGSTLYNCTLSNNFANQAQTLGGGGAYNCTLYNCLLVSNSTAWQGGGAASSKLYNCTVIGNSATNAGGGLASSSGYNSIIYFNSCSSSANMYLGYFSRCCMPYTGLFVPDSVITNDPGLVDLSNGNFRLQNTSLCINAGNNDNAMTPVDLDGNPRTVGGTVDIGAYEFQNPTSLLSYAWLQRYGFSADGSADFADPDQDGMNNWQEWIAGTIPTNKLSVLRIVAATNSPSGVAVSWQSVTTRSYFIQRASDLGAQPAFTTVATNIAGLGGTTIFTETNATGVGPFFYRVGVQQ